VGHGVHNLKLAVVVFCNMENTTPQISKGVRSQHGSILTIAEGINNVHAVGVDPHRWQPHLDDREQSISLGPRHFLQKQGGRSEDGAKVIAICIGTKGTEPNPIAKPAIGMSSAAVNEHIASER
jgi:hypothetical protein